MIHTLVAHACRSVNIVKRKTGEKGFNVQALRAFRGHPFTLIHQELLRVGAPVMQLEGLLVAEPGTVLSIELARGTLLYRWAPATQTDQLADGV